MVLARWRRGGTIAVCAVTVVLVVASLWARGLRVELPPPPGSGSGDSPSLAEPMQLLSRGAENRFEELTPLVSESRRASWRTQSAIVFDLASCPPADEWLDGRDGQRLERLLGELRAGTREDALAGLTLIVQLARRTKWSGSSVQGERLGALLADWLRAWAEPAAADALLHESALAATLLYGRVMAAAWNAPVLGHNRASYEHAHALLSELAGARGGERTLFGRELELRQPRVFAAIASSSEDAFFAALRSEAQLAFPGVDGSCDG